MELTTDPGILPQNLADAKFRDPAFTKLMTASLCPGLYEPLASKEAQKILNDCRKLCDGSPDILSKVLQTKFIANRSPFYWALTGVEAVSRYSFLPPLLRQMVDACGPLSMETQEEILEALYKIDNNSLYQLLEHSLPHVSGEAATAESSSHFSACTAQAVTKESTAQITFNIPQFFDRLLVDQEIVLPTCLANGSLWSLRAEVVTESSSADLTWQFVLTETRTKYPDLRHATFISKRLRRHLSFKIWNANGKAQDCLQFDSVVLSDSLRKTPNVKEVRVQIRDTALASFHGNSYLGPHRSLSGLVAIHDRAAYRDED